MSWIESHQTLGRHPKLIRFASLLKVSRPAAVGHLHYLWWWALDYATDGDLQEYEPRTIADAAEWRKDPDTFWGALVSSGFVNVDDTLHDWDEYAGRMIERRAANAQRMREARAKNVQRTTTARAGATVPDLTVPTGPTMKDKGPSGASAAPIEPNPDQTYLLESLGRKDDAWGKITNGAMAAFRREYGDGVVTEALRSFASQDVTVNGSAFGLLEAKCRELKGAE